MDHADWLLAEQERAQRLLAFVQAELRSMNILARNDFIVELFNFLQPELAVLVKRDQITPP